jgi:protocatechuate 4,5-dioxygenase, beta chain
VATIVGGIATSHIPAIGGAIAGRRQQEPYWKPFFDGYPPVHAWLERVRPDVAVVIYNDHGLNFFLDKMPTFAVGAASDYRNADEGWGLKPVPPFPGDPTLSWHLIESLVADEFDLTTCQEMLVDHGFAIPMSLLWPDQAPCPVRTVPIAVNTVQHPLPSPSRCYKFGRALGKAIESYPQDIKVVLLGTGGLSHQLDGERAGFINKEFDLMCMQKIVDDPASLARYSIHDLVELAGSQGAEFIHWLIMRGALTGRVKRLHSNYHIPISNTGAGLLLLENAA